VALSGSINRGPAWLAAGVFASVAVLAGCHTSPLSGPDGGAGAAGLAGSAGATGAAGTAPGSAGTGSAAGADAQPRCDRTNDAAKITVQTAGGQVFSCQNASPDGGQRSSTFVDKILAVSAAAIVFDSGARVVIDAPGLDLTGVPPNAWVQVKYEFTSFRGCAQNLELTFAEAPDGSQTLPNVGQLVLAISDGYGPFADSSYTVTHVPLGCESGKGCGGETPDLYALEFAAKTGGTTKARAYMGEVVLWNAVAVPYMARNLRSYQTGACDDYLNWAYTIVPALAETIP
jgi:hypothetical protein